MENQKENLRAKIDAILSEKANGRLIADIDWIVKRRMESEPEDEMLRRTR